MSEHLVAAGQRLLTSRLLQLLAKCHILVVLPFENLAAHRRVLIRCLDLRLALSLPVAGGLDARNVSWRLHLRARQLRISSLHHHGLQPAVAQRKLKRGVLRLRLLLLHLVPESPVFRADGRGYGRP